MGFGGLGGNGAMFRARTETDARLHARDVATSRSARRHSRRERFVVALLVTLVLLGWGLYELLV